MIKMILRLLLLFVILLSLSSKAYAATSPTLSALTSYSVLGGSAVTCTGSTTTTGAVGVSPGTSITGFPSPCTASGGTHSNDASAIAAQAEALTTFGTLNQTCDQTFGAVDLTATFPSGVSPGVYCSTSSFTLTGNLNLTGTGVWIFKTVSTLITSPGSSITGGDPCNVWWRIGSSTTLDTTTAFKGTVISQNGANAMNTGATLDGRFIALSAGSVSLNGNTISGPTCASPTPTPSTSSSSTSSTSNSGSASAPNPICQTLNSQIVPPTLISSKRISPTSIYISWGPYSGTNTFNVHYGLTKGDWAYNTDVTGFSTTINGLPANQPIWIEVAARNYCRVGDYGGATLVGGPKLPNTGLSPQGISIPWYLPTGLVVALALLALRKFKQGA